MGRKVISLEGGNRLLNLDAIAETEVIGGNGDWEILIGLVTGEKRHSDKKFDDEAKARDYMKKLFPDAEVLDEDD